ncbi:MAG: succinylglutamate desuccinylase/aspartoacylase family protein [Actinomycetota bacterium]|nr:succinylglutamate desuccinylase/aspartoacylase family protein [Actinomycetota bacterium]
MEIIGVLSAVYFLIHFPYAGAWTFLVSLVLSVLVYWCARRLSKRLRVGDVFAASLIAVWCFLWVAVGLIDGVPKAFGTSTEDFGFFNAIGMAIFTLPICFVARGLIAFRAHRNSLRAGSRGGVQFPSDPWESNGGRMEKHPAFVNKWSLLALLILPMVPLPFFFVQLSRLAQDTPIANVNTTQARLIGRQLGSEVAALAMWLPLTVFLYRQARREALLPAAELGRRNPRSPILYLRSFCDDEIKMRARAANGRSSLERVLKVRFEEVVTDHLWRYGPVVAIGRPGDRLPPLGAARDYVSDEQWQQKVEQLMLSASIIVLVLGRTEGLAWELKKIIELDLIRKLVVLFPPIQLGVSGDLLARWDALREQAGRSGLALPQESDLHCIRAMVFPKRHLAHAVVSSRRDDWAYETVLDAAAELVDPSTRASTDAAAGDSAQP